MKITRIPAAELDSALAQRWRELQFGNSALANPYFCVEYTQSVAAVRGDVFVGIIEYDGAVRGFFPHQRQSASVAGPVGGRLSDYQGLIAAPDFDCDPEQLLRACGLKIWDFDHLLAAQRGFEPFATVRDESPIMQLGDGFQAYLERRKATGSQRLTQLQRKSRKFEREVGELRFEVYSHDPRAFAQVVQWKREQCLRTGVPDFMTWGWTTAMLEQIWTHETPTFTGMLSVLWHDEDIVAAHFGMRSDSVCHWWFPTYNEVYAKHSPGGILLLKLAEAMADAGLHIIDLGKGEDAYKPAFATDAVPLIEGSVMLPSLATTLRRTRTGAHAFLRDSPLLQPARTTYRGLRERLRRRGKADSSVAA
ncbi:MAG: GNAT family N-acetyltransferase [Thiotrichales bacterium]